MTVQPRVFDITIIGGGPTALFAAFYAGLRGMSTRIIESLDRLGGQLTALCPDKFIYDVAGFPAVLAKTLASELIRQAYQHQPDVLLNTQVHRLRRLDEHTIELQADTGRHRTRTLLIAVGGGAFTPKRLPGSVYRLYEGRGLHYAIRDLAQFRGKQVLVIGGGDVAVDWALNLQRVADRITLIHRRDRFRTPEAGMVKLRVSRVDVRVLHELKSLHGTDHVEAATICDRRTGAEQTLAVDAVLVNLGFTTTRAPILDWGLALDEKGIVVTSRMETSIPGVFAAGDVVSYPGKLNLLVTGFSEAAIAVNHAKTLIDPSSSVFPGYSSTVVPRQRKVGQGGEETVGK